MEAANDFFQGGVGTLWQAVILYLCVLPLNAFSFICCICLFHVFELWLLLCGN